MADASRCTDAHDVQSSNARRLANKISVPLKADLLSISTFRTGLTLHRVHLGKYSATELNPGRTGNARFSPIQDDKGHPIPTLYAGTTMQCALMETVFHDVPYVPGLKTLDKQKLANQVHSKLRLTRPLKLVNLGSVALRRIGVTRRELIDTEKDRYPETRAWARAVHGLCKYAQGLAWTSRQDDSARAVMLFGDRLTGPTLEQIDDPRNLLEHESTYAKVLTVAMRLGVDLITTASPES